MCLADYAAYYNSRYSAEVTSNLDDEFVADDSTVTLNSIRPKWRTVARVIWTFQQTDDDPEKSARQKLMLYLPWRDEQSDLYGEYSTYAEHFQAIQDRLTQ